MLENFVFYSSLAYNVVLNKLHIRTWYDRIDRFVILGALPFRGKFSEMLRQEENVRAVISMNQDYELRPFSPSIDEWKKLGIEFLQLSTKDFVEAPSMSNLNLGVELIEKYLTQPESTIYIHCKAGRTRSATLAACYLIKCQNMTTDQAIQLLRTRRSHVYLADIHINQIRQFENYLKSSSARTQ